MSITIETAVLAKAMKSAAAVTEACNIVPILSNARLMADGDELEIVTSNLDVEFRQRLPLASGGALAVTVDAKRLSTLAAAAPRGSQLAIEAEEGRAIVKSGRSRWTAATAAAALGPLLRWRRRRRALVRVRPKCIPAAPAVSRAD